MLGEGVRALATRQHRMSFGDQADAARHLAFGLGLRYCLAANVGKPDGSGWPRDAGREGQLGSDRYLSPGRGRTKLSNLVQVAGTRWSTALLSRVRAQVTSRTCRPPHQDHRKSCRLNHVPQPRPELSTISGRQHYVFPADLYAQPACGQHLISSVTVQLTRTAGAKWEPSSADIPPQRA